MYIYGDVDGLGDLGFSLKKSIKRVRKKAGKVVKVGAAIPTSGLSLLKKSQAKKLIRPTLKVAAAIPTGGASLFVKKKHLGKAGRVIGKVAKKIGKGAMGLLAPKLPMYDDIDGPSPRAGGNVSLPVVLGGIAILGGGLYIMSKV